jgi:hypothetical protein
VRVGRWRAAGPKILKPPSTKDLKAPSNKELKELTRKTGLDKVFEDAYRTHRKVGKSSRTGALSPDDASLEENYHPPGMPELPSNCLESKKCGECFPPANDRLQRVLIRLEKLRRVYAWTKAYKERGIALGDSVGGIHSVSGLAWITERFKIEKSYKQFEAAYDAKYAELVAELRGALQDLSECEEKCGEHDWYNRFGSSTTSSWWIGTSAEDQRFQREARAVARSPSHRHGPFAIAAPLAEVSARGPASERSCLLHSPARWIIGSDSADNVHRAPPRDNLPSILSMIARAVSRPPRSLPSVASTRWFPSTTLRTRATLSHIACSTNPLTIWTSAALLLAISKIPLDWFGNSSVRTDSRSNTSVGFPFSTGVAGFP